MASKLFFAALFSVAAAQTTTISLPFIDWESKDMTASVVAANPTATTFSLVCGKPSSSAESLDCGLFPTQRIVYGPSTYMMEMGDPEGPAVFTGTIDCGDLTKPTVTCKESFGGSDANFPGTSTTEYAGSDVKNLKVVVTAGAEKLQAMTTPASSSATPTASAAQSGSAAASQSGSGTISSVSGITAAVETKSKGAADMNPVALGSGFIGAVAAMIGGLVL